MNTIIEKSDYIFVIPVFNDWESLSLLIQNINIQFIATNRLTYLIVNDSSNEIVPPDFNDNNENNLIIIELNRNMGHQKAIAIGLAYASENLNADKIIVMDSDGEDSPKDILRLIEKSNYFNGIIFARRARRSEGLLFSLLYFFYKVTFNVLTGKKISFGNYSLLPKKYLNKIVQVPDIWNHFSGGVIKSGLPYTSIDTNRGIRYFGASKMSFTNLILHGLSAVSVHADLMAIRLIIFSFILIIVNIIAIVTVFCVRMFTTLAVPGWATLTILTLGIVLFLSILLGLILLFNILTLKTQKSIIPARDYSDFIFDIKINNLNE